VKRMLSKARLAAIHDEISELENLEAKLNQEIHPVNIIKDFVQVIEYLKSLPAGCDQYAHHQRPTAISRNDHQQQTVFIGTPLNNHSRRELNSFDELPANLPTPGRENHQLTMVETLAEQNRLAPSSMSRASNCEHFRYGSGIGYDGTPQVDTPVPST
jgi:hypothetical protein